MLIGMPAYDAVDMLDVAGPFEMFSWAGLAVELVAEKSGPLKFRNGFSFNVDKTFGEAGAWDVLWVPGGDQAALVKLMSDPRRTYLDFLIRQSEHVKYVASVCDGALLLAAAGLLDGYTVTTHWGVRSLFETPPKGEGRRRLSTLLPRSQPAHRRRYLIRARRGVDACPTAHGNSGGAGRSVQHPVLSAPADNERDHAGNRVPASSHDYRAPENNHAALSLH